MKISVFLDNVLTKGALLGGVMLLSSIAENAMFCYGGGNWLVAMTIEFFVVAALYVYLVYRYTKGYADLIATERKDAPYFTYGNGLSYIVTISMLAGVIVACGCYVFRYYIVGYEEFTASYMKFIQDVFVQTEMPAASVDSFEQILREIENRPQPSLISTIFSSVWSYLVSGTVVGLCVAGFTKRVPKNENNDEQ